MIIRLTQKLAKNLKETGLSEKPLNENPLTDWSAHLFTADRTQYILVCNTKTFYSFLMLKRGITNDRRLIDGVLAGIREAMEADGLWDVYHKRIATESDSVQFAKALNRSVTASMNRLVQFAQWLLIEDGMPPSKSGSVSMMI